MLKKVLVGGFLLIMVGAVVTGLVALFTQSESAHVWQGYGRGDEYTVAHKGASNQIVPGGQGRGQEGQRIEADARSDEVAPGGGYGRGQEQGNPQRLRTEPQVEVADWQTVKGVVLETTELVIETADGQSVQVGLGPSHYRESQDFVLEIGDKVRVSGYWEGDEFIARQVENLDTGESIVLRDAYGRPMWAGWWARRSG